MNNKTCGECKYLDGERYCEFLDFEPKPEMGGCANFEPKPTKGDRIRQMSNEEIAAFVCGVLNDRREETFRSVLDLLNAPAESEVRDE